MDLGIAGRTALVTASSRGLGRGAAKALAEEGCRVVICARRAETLEEARSDVTGAAQAAGRGGDVHAIVADVTEPSAPARLVRETAERFGALDILVANAGGPPRGHALELDDDALASAVNANLLTTVRLVREAVPHMHGWGRICAIASSTVKEPNPVLAASNTARTGLWAWAKTAAADLADQGITLNLACPGTHLTDRIKELGGPAPGERVGDPEDFGRVVAFLCSEPAGFISGTAVMVDGARSRGLL